ncbi:hypothetical protein N7509_005036 [Penicillium cosmopolitanum]|uniref:Uncharacterized protein n=1 Tax=Penicillium cosmopolitanum TaxID=1131564 RepID=A0A9W9W1F2_9EURO|nr:uncharacterized protein N7509_005036 [Penicillium cosmopolitanum]KAJ5396923.1 hypothetical protein N7509_005036 [Penicillium cosmopolitanum]
MRPVAAYDSTFAELVSIHGFYKKRYGEPEEYKYRGVTNQRCDLPLNQVDKRRQGIDDYTYFLQLLADADKTRLELFIVLNGWNALTTDPLTFVTLFYGRTCKITLRVFTSSPNPNAKLFHDAGVREVSTLSRVKLYWPS